MPPNIPSGPPKTESATTMAAPPASPAVSTAINRTNAATPHAKRMAISLSKGGFFTRQIDQRVSQMSESKQSVIRPSGFLGFVLVLVALHASASALKAPPSNPFDRIDRCVLEPDEWTDGDSFRVRLPDGRLQTFRL